MAAFKGRQISGKYCGTQILENQNGQFLSGLKTKYGTNTTHI